MDLTHISKLCCVPREVLEPEVTAIFDIPVALYILLLKAPILTRPIVLAAPMVTEVVTPFVYKCYLVAQRCTNA